MFPIKKMPSLAWEIRIILGVYLLLMMASWFYLSHQNAQAGQALAGMFRSNRNLYQLQEWEGQADQELNEFFRNERIPIQETRWELREKNGRKPVEWAETEYRLGSTSIRSAKAMADFEQRLDDKVAYLGIIQLSNDQIKLDGTRYLRLNYGISWDGRKIVTHRLYFAFPDSATAGANTGLAMLPKKVVSSPKLKLTKILPTPKPKVQATIAPPPAPKTRPETTVKPPNPTVSRTPANPVSPDRPGPRVAIIIDDMGFVKSAAEAYFQIKAPLTVAVMPGGPYSREQALLAEQAGFQVLLHQPLEPIDRIHNNPGPGVIDAGETDDEIRRQFEANLADVPGAVGFNNHMGSAGTQNRRLMTILLSEAKKDGLFFVDSKSIGNSVGEDVARQLGVPHASRQIFLDNTLAELRAQLEELKRIALRDGSAIAIAHARPGVAEVIAEYLPILEKAGIKVVHVSELLR